MGAWDWGGRGFEGLGGGKRPYRSLQVVKVVILVKLGRVI